MKEYIGIKRVKAEPMTRKEAEKYLGRSINTSAEYGEDGFLVVYPDDYESWSPAEVFLNAYRVTQDYNAFYVCLPVSINDYAALVKFVGENVKENKKKEAFEALANINYKGYAVIEDQNLDESEDTQNIKLAAAILALSNNDK